MNKFLVVTACAVGLCSPAWAATIVHAPANTAGTVYSHDTADDLPYQVNQLRSQVKALQGQVSALQDGMMQSNDASDAPIWPVGTGG
ncbi:MAG TPA: hypothetical protein VNC39_12260 [Acidocella sp.]|uniref:hypothetical protein n=1 Tax=Acidocella sp. TaxID=50710 RepID=UPI002B6C6AB2|nr:hypothetical protein [Acidocella sp.]HVE22741.1 hypothetical protein [Acidocella sp.]